MSGASHRKQIRSSQQFLAAAIARPGQLSAGVRVRNDRPGPVTALLSFQVKNDRGETVQEFTRAVGGVAPGGETTVMDEVAIPDGAELINLARKLDPTRLALFVCQLDLYEAVIGAVRKSDVCGLVVWSWADYVGSREMNSSPATFGVMTRDRQPKRNSLDVLSRIFAEGQSLFSKAPHKSESSTLNKP